MISFDSAAEYRGAVALVLGSSGFIGRWVARTLAECGARVVRAVRDRRSVAGDAIEADLMQPGSARELLRAVRPSITFNLAGYGVDRRERDETAAWRLNAEAVRELASAIAEVRDSKWRGADLVHVGSALEYGAASGDLAEDCTPLPSTPYGKSKLEGTRIVADAAAGGGLKAFTARLFTVYGPGEHAGRLLPSLTEAARTGAPVDLTAGSQKRDFTYVEDVAEGLCRLAFSGAVRGEAINLATGRLTTVCTFAETAAAILNIPGERLRFGKLPPRTEEMEHSAVSLNRLRRLAAWTPGVGIEEGIYKTVQREAYERSHVARA
jgi:nucleoside-diphosphate-sugar epimerase